MNGRNALTLALVLAAPISCRPDDQRTDQLDVTGGAQARESMPPDAVAQLDSGSLAFRRDDFEAALAHYTRVTEVAPDFGAGWFGVYMAHDRLGNVEAAAAALERARGVVPGASLLHPDTVP
jgi:tetratricopeptide (TPR) repeat protein